MIALNHDDSRVALTTAAAGCESAGNDHRVTRELYKSCSGCLIWIAVWKGVWHEKRGRGPRIARCFSPSFRCYDVVSADCSLKLSKWQLTVHPLTCPCGVGKVW